MNSKTPSMSTRADLVPVPRSGPMMCSRFFSCLFTECEGEPPRDELAFARATRTTLFLAAFREKVLEVVPRVPDSRC